MYELCRDGIHELHIFHIIRVSAKLLPFNFFICNFVKKKFLIDKGTRGSEKDLKHI